MSDQSAKDAVERQERPVTASAEETASVEAIFWAPAEAAWQFAAGGYAPAREGEIEAALAVGNGFFGSRASLEFPTPVSQPRTYVAGLFGQPPSQIQTPMLFSAPDWLRIHLLVDGELVSPTSGEMLEEQRILDARRGILTHALRWRGPRGAVLRLRIARFASQARRALGVQYATLEVERPALLTLEPRGRELAGQPLEFVECESATDLWRTPGRAHWLAVSQCAAVQVGGMVQRPVLTSNGPRWQWHALPDEVAYFARFVMFGRGDGGPESEAAAIAKCKGAARAIGREIQRRGTLALLQDHVRAWEERWAASDVALEGESACQQAVRFAAYHLQSAANPEDPSVSIGARGLTGDAYYGHVFWDTDIYMLPFFLYTWPEAARAMLLYRYRMLPGARAKAQRLGYRGAFYAWESADTGDEATPQGVIGPDGREVVYPTATQAAHISADVAYAVWQYWQITGDEAFLRDAGAEILLETARFWASRASREPGAGDGAYHIRHVIGPDEYHEDVDDNAYTNALARWNLGRALEVSAWLRARWPERWAALAAQLGLGDEELAAWRDVAEHLVSGYDPATGLFEQFAGYSRLEPIDLEAYAPRGGAMDVALGHERIRQTQVIKQPDVVMLLALLWDEVPAAARQANFAYYAPRCSHGSSLSPGIHALVAARLGDLEAAGRYFRRAAEIDERDIRRDAASGVHLATQGSIWQAAILGCAGLRELPAALAPGGGPGGGSAAPEGLRLDPHPLPGWQELRFAAQYRGRLVRFALRGAERTLTATLERGAPLALAVGERQVTLRPGTPWMGGW